MRGLKAVKRIVVAKFGGSVLKDGKDFENAAGIVESLREKNNVVVVVSAMKSVTDKLLELATNFKLSPSTEIPKLYRLHVNALKEARVSERVFEDTFSRMARLIDELTKIVWAIRVLGEVTQKALDYVMSFGERLSALVMEATLKSKGVEAISLTGWEAGIVTDENFGAANPIMEETVPKVRSKLLPLLEKGVTPVVTGFIAATKRGEITTLGRGGSDFTASILASILKAQELHFYTDVPGVMTADPKFIKEAVTVPQMCVIEALEFSRAGGKKFHPRTFEPLINADTITKILNAYDPQGPHTTVTPVCNESLKAVTIVPDVVGIRVEAPALTSRNGLLARVLQCAFLKGIEVVAVDQPVTETTFEIYVPRRYANQMLECVNENLSKHLKVDVSGEEKLAAITVIGYGLRKPKVRSKVVNEALANAPDIRFITLGFHQASLTMVMPLEDAIEAAYAIHGLVLRELRLRG